MTDLISRILQLSNTFACAAGRDARINTITLSGRAYLALGLEMQKSAPWKDFTTWTNEDGEYITLVSNTGDPIIIRRESAP